MVGEGGGGTHDHEFAIDLLDHGHVHLGMLQIVLESVHEILRDGQEADGGDERNGSDGRVDISNLSEGKGHRLAEDDSNTTHHPHIYEGSTASECHRVSKATRLDSASSGLVLVSR
jgi:hypothetical protein